MADVVPASAPVHSSADAYEQLRREIVSGRLQPNERLVEADLTRALGVTRTAVRAALQRLAHEGLVEHERNRGAKVRFVSEQEAVEILKAAENARPEDLARLRALTGTMRELLATGDLLTMSEANTRLHEILLELAGHRTVERLVSTLNSQLVRFQYRTILVLGRPEQSLAEHTAIVEAVAAGDPEAAEAAMRRHLSKLTEALRAAAALDGRPFAR
jgi:DNA-binding GntR family transcriptional regulator